MLRNMCYIKEEKTSLFIYLFIYLFFLFFAFGLVFFLFGS